MSSKQYETAHIAGQLSFPGEGSEAESAPGVSVEVLEEPGDAGIISGPNTRIRARNAMHRAREGAIRGALETIALRGLKGLTMVEAADRGGVARATLYNHARDKDALLELVLDRETRDLARAFVEAESLERALAGAATSIAEHPALKGIREHDAVALVRLGSASDPRVRRLAADALRARGCSVSESNVDMALRWLASFVSVPSERSARDAQAGSLAKMLGA